MKGPKPEHQPVQGDPDLHPHRAWQTPALPSKELLDIQATWLGPARSRILRRIGIAHKHQILDLGAGYGQISAELARRSSGKVIAFDLNSLSLREVAYNRNVFRVAGDGTELPFKSATFDMVLSHFSLLWIKPLHQAINEIDRVLEPAGVLFSLEPDYESMIEYPATISCREIWLDALNRSGADPAVGRKLPGMLEILGYSVRVDLLEQIKPPAPQRFDYLQGLPLTQSEQANLRDIRDLASNTAAGDWQQISHLPIFLITAVKSGPGP